LSAKCKVLALDELKIGLQRGGHVEGHNHGFVGVWRDAFDAQGVKMGAHSDV
jgi:hypothetical protein